VITGPRARLQVLAAALLFSTGGAAIKATSFSGWQVAGLRSGVAALAVLALSPGARHGWFNRRTVVVALLYAATLTLFVLANKLTTAANTIFLQATAPVYVLIAGTFFLREPFTRRDAVVMATIGLGMAMFFVGRERSFASAPDPARGNLLAALSGVTYALMLVGLRWMGRSGGSPQAAVALGNAVAFLVALPIAAPFGGHGVLDWSVILYLGVVQIGLAYSLLTGALKVLPAFEASLLLYLEPALNPVWAWQIHGERPAAWALLGGVIILGATGFKAWGDSRLAGRAGAA
jgi:DME family drug/metabolite transporter